MIKDCYALPAPVPVRESRTRLSKNTHVHASDLHGLSRLAIDGVLGTTALVEEMHYAISRVSGPSLPSRNKRTRGITGLVGPTTDRVFGQIVPRLAAPQSTRQRDPEQRLPTHRAAVVPRTGHLELMHHPAVARHLGDWLTEP